MMELLFKCEQCGFEYNLNREIRCPRCFDPALKYNSCQGCNKCKEKECDNKMKK